MEGLYFVIAGFAGGIIGGMGMGGGTLLIPILTIILSVGQLEAQAINLISFIPMALVSLVVHVKNKLVDFKQLIYVLPLATALAVGGAYMTDVMSEALLRKIFGAFMLAIGVIFMIKSLSAVIISKLNDHKIDA